MKVVNLAGKFATFSDRFNPRIVGELNNFQVKLVKVQGEFMWHHHDEEDEMFLVVYGGWYCSSKRARSRSTQGTSMLCARASYIIRWPIRSVGWR